MATCEPYQPRPYKIGHKIRILLSNGTPGDHRVTFGEVVEAKPEQMPAVKYKDFSSTTLGKFDRVVKANEVVMRGKFKETIWKY